MAETCFVCGTTLDANERLVLVRGKLHEQHCSESCLRRNFQKRRISRTSARRWWLLCALIALLPAAANILWQRYRAQQPEVIVSGPPEISREPTSTAAVPFGPAWPPTDADWMAAFSREQWTYPLPGPIRRTPKIDPRIFGPEPPTNHPARCRKADHCGADLGGDLWGEHVYAVHDGVVDRVQGAGNEERGGLYVRLSHLGGMVFTQYFHLAAIPRGLSRGVRVRAGEVIGLLGDSGILTGSRRHLHFALSVRPSTEFSEVYWDPLPWMCTWPLHLPPHGTVAGLMAMDKQGEIPRRRQNKRAPMPASR